MHSSLGSLEQPSGARTRSCDFLTWSQQSIQDQGNQLLSAKVFKKQQGNIHAQPLQKTISQQYFSFSGVKLRIYNSNFSDGSDSKDSTYNTGDAGSVPGSGRSPGEGKGNSLQYSCLEQPMDRGAWRGYSPCGRKESDMTEQLTLACLLTQQLTHFKTLSNTCNG